MCMSIAIILYVSKRGGGGVKTVAGVKRGPVPLLIGTRTADTHVRLCRAKILSA